MSEFTFLTEILTEVDLPVKNDYKIAVIILSSDKNDFVGHCDILGQSANGLLHKSCEDYDVYEAQYSGEADYVKIASQFADSADYLVLLHSDTPLISHTTLVDAIDYATCKNLDYCFLHRGVILKSSSVQKSSFELSSKADFLNKEDFIRVYDNVSLSKVREILEKRIVFSHIANGVDIVSPANVYIDYNVSIAKGVIIMPFNSIRGNSRIGENTIIMEHNTIINSTIGQNCKLSACIVRDSIIKDGSRLCLENILGDKK